MKVLLVGINAKYIHSNLAIQSLKAYAGKYKENIEIVEYTINHYKDFILGDIFKKKPDIIGFSCYIWNIELVTGIMTELHKVLPNTQIWLGGPEVSYRPNELLKEYPYIKGIAVGEGEKSFLNLMEHYIDDQSSLKEIRGIVYQDENGTIISNPVAEIMDMSTIPFPYQELDKFKNRIIYYESSRGCPFSCSYCLSSVEKRVRFRNVELVKEELKHLLDCKVPQVKFVDRTFNCDHKHTIEIWGFLKENDNGITNFHFEIAADLLNEEELDLIASMRPGLIQLEIGVQSTNPETLKAIDRTMDLSKLTRIVEKINKKENIHQHLDLIAGLPYENYESFGHSFNQVYAMRPNQLQLGFLKLLSGTVMDQKKEEYNIVYQEFPPYEVLYTKWLSFDELLRLKNVEEMVEVYYNSNQFIYGLKYLEKLFETPFELYEKLADFYESKGFFELKHNRIDRYFHLFEFAKEFTKANDEIGYQAFSQLLVFDLYLRENIKSRPSFAEDESEYKEFVRRFYEEQEKENTLLPDYLGYNSKQMSRMTHIEKFCINPFTMKKEETYILFDYKNRNPLTYEARTLEIH
ncbi:MAG: B12-binding domain-containing radical SAM protein [Clostridiales bacterium]|nr:B12-binding domain-containing radical SAM protein [Clostridiales bacterium]